MILGEHDRSSSNENIQVLKVGKVSKAQQILSSSSPTLAVVLHWQVTSSQVFKHSRFSIFTTNNDITLIKLASPAQLNIRVSPVCVAESTDDFPGGMTCVTSGWGLLRHNGKSQSQN